MTYAPYSQVVKSMQTGGVTISSGGTTGDVTITAIDTAKSFVIVEYCSPAGYNGSNNPFPTFGASITSTTNIRLYLTHQLTSGHDAPIYFRVVEYY